MAKQDDYVRYTIRVPSDLYGKLQEAAGEKSINAEINERLWLTFRRQYLDLSDEGLVAVLRSASALERGLAELFFFYRDVDLDGFIEDQSRAGNVMEKTEAVSFILRQYLSERGYVQGPPNRRRGLKK